MQRIRPVVTQMKSPACIERKVFARRCGDAPNPEGKTGDNNKKKPVNREFSFILEVGIYN